MERGLRLERLVNYTPFAVGAAFLLFGGWYVISAASGSRAPIRMGTEDELEAIERGYEHPSGPAPAAT